MSTSPRRRTCDELLSDKFQMSIGVRHRFDCCLVSFGITENLQNLNNTPDIGFQMGFAWVPRLKPQTAVMGTFRFASKRGRASAAYPLKSRLPDSKPFC